MQCQREIVGTESHMLMWFVYKRAHVNANFHQASLCVPSSNCVHDSPQKYHHSKPAFLHEMKKEHCQDS